MVDEFMPKTPSPPGPDRPIDASHETSADSEGGYAFIFHGGRRKKDEADQENVHTIPDIGPAVKVTLSEKALKSGAQTNVTEQTNDAEQSQQHPENQEPRSTAKPGKINITV